MKADIAKTVIERLKEQGKTIATAESCTGGLVGKLLTDVAGSSAVYRGGIISYTNEVKQKLLGVRAETIRQFTAVSAQTAGEMAQGALLTLGVDFAISTTGLAGPDGDGTGRPVGLVYVAVSTEEGTIVQELHLTGNREEIRLQAAETVLRLLLSNM